MNKRGTTLIELLVVLIVLTALLSISVPAIANLTSPKQQLRNQARAVHKLLQTARLTAIRQHRQIEVVVDPAGNKITAQETGYVRQLDSSGDEIIDTNRFSRSIILEDVTISTDATNELITAVSFTPFGSSDGGRFRFVKDRASLELVCDVLTGRPSVKKPERDTE